MPLVASEAGSNCRRGANSLPGQGNGGPTGIMDTPPGDCCAAFESLVGEKASGGPGPLWLEHPHRTAREDRSLERGFVKPLLEGVSSTSSMRILYWSAKK